MAHDQLFKDLLQAFFREFMELFFPEVASRLDFSTVTFLMQEVFTDIPEGERRTLDLIAQVTTLEGEAELVLVHLEVQAERRSVFPSRMSEYYMLMRLRHRLPVFPVVVYLVPGTGGLTQETHTEMVFGRNVLRFQYDAIGLPDLEADAYRASDNPLAPALSALMRPGPLGRLAQKIHSLRRVLLSDVDDARKSLLVNVIETYLPLNVLEQEEFDALLRQEDRSEVRDMVTIYEIRGQRKLLLLQLRQKFGDLPEAATARIQKMETEEELEQLSLRLLSAASLTEMGLLENTEI